MSTSKQAILAASGIALCAAMPVLGHHALEAKYDRNRMITVKGTVMRMTWNNPHVRLYLDGKDDSQPEMKWELEMASPNALLRTGWKIDTVRRGDHVTVSAYPAKDGSSVGYATKVTVTPP